MGLRDDDPLLIAERSREIRIDTGEEALHRVNDAIEETDVTTELDYLRAVKTIIQHGQADWFDAVRAMDEEPPDHSVDEEAIAEELAELESNLPDEVRDEFDDEDDLLEMLEGIREEKEVIEAAMEMDHSEFLQGDDEEE